MPQSMHQLSIVPFSGLEYTHKKKHKFSETGTVKINSTVPLHSEIKFDHFSLTIHTVALHLTGYEM